MKSFPGNPFQFSTYLWVRGLSLQRELRRSTSPTFQMKISARPWKKWASDTAENERVYLTISTGTRQIISKLCPISYRARIGRRLNTRTYFSALFAKLIYFAIRPFCLRAESIAFRRNILKSPRGLFPLKGCQC